MSTLDRALCAQQFLRNHLTSRERMLVAAFALGYNQVQVADAWAISTPAVNRMARRIRLKAAQYWNG